MVEGNYIAKEVVAVQPQKIIPAIKAHTVNGKVLSIEGNIINVETKTGNMAVTVNQDTKYRVPNKENPTLADVKVGDQVIIVGNKTDTAFVAKEVVVPPPPTVMVTGKVSGISGNIITIETAKGNLNITVNEDTKYRIPGKKNAAPGDIKVGDRITVLGQRSETGYVAKAVTVILVPRQIQGVVTAVSDNTVTAKDKDGNTFTVTMNLLPEGVSIDDPIHIVIGETGKQPIPGNMQ